MDDDTRTRPTGDDEGKDVIDASGELIGEVSEHRGDTLVVDADPSITDQIKSVLGWGETDDVYRIDETEIDRISDNAVHVRTTEHEDPGGRAGASDAGATETSPGGAATEAGRTTTDDDRSPTGRQTVDDRSDDEPMPGETTEGDDVTGTGDRTMDEGSHGDAGHDDREGLTDDELREAGESDTAEGVPDDERRLTDDDADDSDDGHLSGDDDDDSDDGVLSDDDDDDSSRH
ncbi:hypothetical protein [Natronoarchaeum rubrum]|uniref:hypothetical protein n=1 Tax=Natronoarchaeum rubrum TaxID=755311 RepID=UPI002113333C|nr:hypothetical protein [Natronoarchaeum rubrum]